MGLWDWVVWNEVLKTENKLTTDVIKMKSYCLKCKKNTENINSKVSAVVMVGQWYYQGVQYVVVKNPDLLKIKKQKDY